MSIASIMLSSSSSERAKEIEGFDSRNWKQRKKSRWKIMGLSGALCFREKGKMGRETENGKRVKKWRRWEEKKKRVSGRSKKRKKDGGKEICVRVKERRVLEICGERKR
jgi:hypothetical protein